ncbi:MAG: TROVE domain-containing protein [Armatimonadetes bacterium]|nr:TROVE domain-containing protein [Armatimonadota bacterium]
MSYLNAVANRKVTPQNLPIPGTSQVANSAGGYAFPVDDWTRLSRFLVLGSEKGSYYATQTALTAENAEAVGRCIDADGERTVREIVAVSNAGRAPKNDPAIFALALAASLGSETTRKAALDALPTVCRTGTHLFHFAQFVDGMRGWGRGLRGAVARWYDAKPIKSLAYQAVKYGQRDGWSHRDLLRLAHPKPGNEARRILYHWIAQGWERIGDVPHDETDLQIVWAMEKAKLPGTTAKTVAELIRTYDLPREAVPTLFLNDSLVWEALLERMPLTALLRNLATLTRVGVLDSKAWQAHVTKELTDAGRLKAARVHPLSVLAALKTYAQGHGERGKHTWSPVGKIVDALDAAFYASFGNVESTGKRFVLALDVSGSMGYGDIAGMPGITPRIGSAAMALITAATEGKTETVSFQTSLTRLAISPRQRLDDVLKAVSGLPFGGTDCALPMVWATKNRVEADAFVVYTDSETWHGAIHPVQALREYRQKTGIAARLIVVGMVANAFSIADPEDGGMLDVVGFDTATPLLIGDLFGVFIENKRGNEPFGSLPLLFRFPLPNRV